MMLKAIKLRSPFLQVTAGWSDCVVIFDDEEHDMEKTVLDLLDSGQAFVIDLGEVLGRRATAKSLPVQ